MINELLANKAPDYAEVEVFMFEHCNLRCIHCFQDHTAHEGMSEASIMEKADIIERFFERTPKQTVILNIMGGELFQDDLLDTYLPIYSKFIYRLQKAACLHSKQIRLNFVTNLLMTKHNVFINWLEEHGLKLSVSYDHSGRFNNDQYKLFKQNIDVYSKYVSLVCSVATAQNIKLVMQRSDPYFDYLYGKFDFYWDQLTPGPTVPTSLVPSERQYLDFMLFLLEHYPNCTNLEAFTNGKTTNKMSCPSLNKLVVESNNNTSSCRIQKHTQSQDFISIVDVTNVGIIQKWVDDKGCLECEYFNRCPFSCFVRNDWKRLIRDFDGCVYKEVFKRVDCNGSNN